MALSPDQQVIAAAIDVLASVSKNRLALAMGDKPQSSVLVDPHAFGRLAHKVEALYPGAIAKVRDARLKRRAEYDAKERARREAEYEAWQRKIRESREQKS